MLPDAHYDLYDANHNHMSKSGNALWFVFRGGEKKDIQQIRMREIEGKIILQIGIKTKLNFVADNFMDFYVLKVNYSKQIQHWL